MGKRREDKEDPTWYLLNKRKLGELLRVGKRSDVPWKRELDGILRVGKRAGGEIEEVQNKIAESSYKPYLVWKRRLDGIMRMG